VIDADRRRQDEDGDFEQALGRECPLNEPSRPAEDPRRGDERRGVDAAVSPALERGHCAAELFHLVEASTVLVGRYKPPHAQNRFTHRRPIGAIKDTKAAAEPPRSVGPTRTDGGPSRASHGSAEGLASASGSGSDSGFAGRSEVAFPGLPGFD
jgi:hypothetical protein